MRALQAVTGRMAGVPFTLLAGHESMASIAWITTSTELIDMAVSAQRRTFDRTLAVHQQLVDEFTDTGTILACDGVAGPMGAGATTGLLDDARGLDAER